MEKFEPYEIEKDNILYKSSFGVVYKARHNYIEREMIKSEIVALEKLPQEIKEDQEKLTLLTNKILNSTKINEKENDDEEDEIKMFDYNYHKEDNIVKLIDIANIEDDLYLAYEFCNGGNLRRYLRYFKSFDEKMIQYIMKQIIHGLNIIHKRKIYHHDLCPDNIFVDLRGRDGYPLPEEKIKIIMDITNPDNRELNKDESVMKNDELKEILFNSKIKISGFGLYKYAKEIRNKEIIQNLLYMDPNSLDDEPNSETIEKETIDIWALGIIAYELFFYDLPFQPFPPSIDKIKQCFKKGQYTIDLSKCKEVSKEFLSFLDMCLQREQNIRPLTDELMFSEFIIRDPDNFVKLNINNYTDEKIAKYPDESYTKEKGKIIMNIDNNRMLNACFDTSI